MQPLCFVLMPFGVKKDEMGKLIDFDTVYATIVAPAIVAAGLEPIRADEEQVGGAIHKPMYERLMLCDYAVADVTGANPNVYYELGIRHALRPRSTLIVFAAGTTLPFDIAPLRGLPYRLDSAGKPCDAAADASSIQARLAAARDGAGDDSPLFQLVEGMPHVEIDHAKTDIFRARASYSQQVKDRLTAARRAGKAAVLAVASDPAFQNLAEVESGIVVDLFLSLRAVSAHAEMLALYERMPLPLQRVRMMREQLAFAFNRLGRRDDAERVLVSVIADFGPSSETNGLLGRVHKDRWDDARRAGDDVEARGHLKKAIATYLAGFEADWRDAYPGINAVTLMEMLDRPDPRQAELLPLVRYAARRHAALVGDYWDHATQLELAVIARDPAAADESLAEAVAVAREAWEPETTARTLASLREARQARGEDVDWMLAIEQALLRRRDKLAAP